MPTPYDVTSLPPGLPSLSDTIKGVNTSPGYGNIIDMIKATGNVPGMTEAALPSIANILGPSGSGVNPYANAIMANTSGNVAAAQSDAMKRGLTGSDIEASNMTMARSEGQQNLSQLYAQNAAQLAQMIQQAVSGDINTNRETILMLAQAMGQELTSQRDLEQFQKQLSASMEMAKMQANAQKTAAIIGAVGQVAGGVATGGGMALGKKLFGP